MSYIVCFILNFFAFFWGDPDKKSEVMSPELIDAIEKVNSDSKPQEIIMGGKKFRIKKAIPEN